MNKLAAKIKLQAALMLARDIQAYKAGDISRFDRMVDGKGKGIVNLDIAIRNIKMICLVTAEVFPVTSMMLLHWLSYSTGPQAD